MLPQRCVLLLRPERRLLSMPEGLRRPRFTGPRHMRRLLRRLVDGRLAPLQLLHVALQPGRRALGAPRDAYAAANDSADMMPRLTASPKPMSSSANKAPAARKAAYIVSTAAGENFIYSAMTCARARCQSRFYGARPWKGARAAYHDCDCRSAPTLTTTEAVGKKLQMALLWRFVGIGLGARFGHRGVGRGLGAARAAWRVAMPSQQGRDPREPCRESRSAICRVDRR